ncbi:ABC transporter substrate-binding protein [bacterium]|nr:ABC transporter substrate-binding protein [bacterium]
MIRLYLSCLLLLSWIDCIYAQENVLIVRKKGREFQSVFDSIKSEIEGDFRVHDYVIQSNVSYQNFVKTILDKKIDFLVLMDNQAINYGKRLKNHKNRKLSQMGGVATMGLNIDKILKGEKRITGVNYEVPAFTIITSFRKLSQSKVEKVLVFYRASEFSHQVETAKILLQKEGIQLEMVNVERNGTSLASIIRFLRRHLRSRVVRSNADAVLVLSDSVLLNQKSFLGAWIPTARSIKKPFLCGIESLTSLNINFCTYSASPDHNELGSQVSQLVYSILEDKEEIEFLEVERILSVDKTLNAKKMKWMRLRINESHLDNVKVLK